MNNNNTTNKKINENTKRRIAINIRLIKEMHLENLQNLFNCNKNIKQERNYTFAKDVNVLVIVINNVKNVIGI